MTDEYRTLLLDAYKGELLGDALFEAFAAHESGERADKLRTLQRIEANTASQLRPLLTTAAIELSADDEATPRRQGTEMGNAGMDWGGFVKGLHDALPSFLASFVRLRSIAPDASHPALVALVNHEQAINAFAELELAGHPERSRAVLDWYLETAR